MTTTTTTTTTTTITTATTTTSTTTPFQSSHNVRTLTSSHRQAVSSNSNDYREERYWNDGSTVHTLSHTTETLAIQQLALSSQRTLVAAGGPRISVWSGLDKSLHHKQQLTSSQTTAKQISTSGQLSTAVAFRHDGQLLAVGNRRGQVYILQCATRAILTTWQCSALPIRAVVWHTDQTVWVAGDDACLSQWSLMPSRNNNSNSSRVSYYRGHGDAIHCLKIHPQDSLIATASADHTVRLWNLANDNIHEDNKEAVAIWMHAGPVQDLVWVPTTTTTDAAAAAAASCCITASGTVLTVWSTDNNHESPLQVLPTRHVKTITALHYLLRRRRRRQPPQQLEEQEEPQHCLFSASLDGTLRLYEWNPTTRTLISLIQLSLPQSQIQIQQQPMTALTAFTHRSCVVIACGFSQGQVVLRITAPPPTILKRRAVDYTPPAGTYAYFMRGPRVPLLQQEDTTIIATTPKKRKYKSYDLCLKQFRYADALEEALATRNAQTVLTVLNALGQRPDGFRTALSLSLQEPVLSFCLSFLRKQQTQHQHATSCIVGVLEECWTRRQRNNSNDGDDELWWKIRQALQQEVQTQTCLLQTLGQIDCLLGAHALEETAQQS